MSFCMSTDRPRSGRGCFKLLGWFFLAITIGVGIYGFWPTPFQPAGSKQVRAGLRELSGGRGDWGTFSVSYRDLHAVHGGVTITVHGDGRFQRQFDGEGTRVTLRIQPHDLARLVDLLLDIRAWEQETYARDPAADDSRAYLTVRL